jgi:hypothetical protein
VLFETVKVFAFWLTDFVVKQPLKINKMPVKKSICMDLLFVSFPMLGLWSVIGSANLVLAM